MKRVQMLGMAVAMMGGLGLATAANAAPLPVAPSDAGRGDVAQVGYGCPYGWLPNGYGGCRRPYRRSYDGYGPRRPYYGGGGYGPRRFY